MATTVANKASMMEAGRRYSPFYVPPSCVIKTSAEIVSEARAAMEHKTVRAVNTKRPYTPRDSHRILFGRNSVGRPPSAISLGQVQFQDFENSLPKLGSGNVSSLYAGGKLPKLQRTRLPAIYDARSRKHLKSTASLDNLPEEAELEMFENLAGERQIHSSPQERTCGEVAVQSPALSGILRRSLSVDQVICEESGEDEEESKGYTPNKKFPLVVEIKKKPDKATRDFKSLAFPDPERSPQRILGMDKLMETTDNHINEARAYVRDQDVVIDSKEEMAIGEESSPDSVDGILDLLYNLRKQGWPSMSISS